ncbi:EAL domain-containing protein [sulfur-oxidizing endosymbiont of Gigantopelta aegis]|uniref:EAL domain-containing protein n=1 Tax=sulfur-oxidizing endosymbiont of Gigantopelta aegis TaxID=2794934 RepID=UPI0018DB4E5B|nr:EAL domain-containing protein [sulfur-oxidizing endosymbiont of Gigantopelta aegis]
MNNYKWHLAIITFVLLSITSVFIFYDEDKNFLTEQTSSQIDELLRLSLNEDNPFEEDASFDAQAAEQLRKHKIITLIKTLETQAEKVSLMAESHLDTRKTLFLMLILLIFVYLSYVLLKVLNTSKRIEASNIRIKSEITKIQTTFSSIGDAVITTDRNGLIDYMNPSAKELTNYYLKEKCNTPINIVFKIFNENNYLLPDPNAQAIKEERLIKGKQNIFLQRRGGSRLPIIYTIAPIHDSDNTTIGTIIVFHDTSETHKLTKALSWQATHDALTKLPNRTLLKDKLESSLEKARENQTLLTLFFIDLDDFKPVNDEYGHAQGDKVLQIISQRLLTVIRNEDMVARLGGDEFVITLLSFNEPSEITKALERVMSTISQPIPVGSANVILSASIGVSIFPDDNSDADTLLRHADQSMYIAKQKGRNQYHFFDVESNQVSTQKESQRQRLEQALDNDEFFLVYQPKVNMRTGHIYGFEALIRWQHPEEGVILPVNFIPLCEESDLIVRIGDWVFTQSLNQLSLWLKSGFDFRLAINIAPRQFEQTNFIQKLDDLLALYPDISASLIELEVLESAALQDTGRVSEIIKACHQRDISIALDDFGSGYASLSYLKQLPANQLKIDKSFVLDMLTDEGDLAIVEGIISLAGIFKRQVIAEGVETREHGVMLLRLGCDMAQGYGISRPMTHDKVLDWSKNWSPDPNWLLWSETSWDISDFPLLIAHSDHFTGINEVIKSIYAYHEKEDELFDLVGHHHCRLGKWYYDIGKEKYQHLNCFQTLGKPHKEAHELAKHLLQLCHNGKQNKAIEQIPQLITLRDKVIDKLNDLQQEILEQHDKKTGDSDYMS